MVKKIGNKTLSKVRKLLYTYLVKKTHLKELKNHENTSPKETIEAEEGIMADSSTSQMTKIYGKNNYLEKIFMEVLSNEPRPADLIKLWELFDVRSAPPHVDQELPNMVKTETEIVEVETSNRV